MTMVLLTAFPQKMLLMTELLVITSLLLILEKGSVGGNAAAVDTVDNDLATDDTINSWGVGNNSGDDDNVCDVFSAPHSS